MSYRYIFVVGTVLLLFAHLSSRQSSWHFSRQSSTTQLFSDSSFHKRMTPIAKAYFTGDKTHLKRKIIRLHKKLGLMHLMTPSGLHLSSFFLLLKPFAKQHKIKCILSLVFYLLLFPLDSLNSLKRMSLFSFFKVNPIMKINSVQSFTLTFFISFLMGDYGKNALSFSLSLLFLGALLFCKHRKDLFVSLVMVHLLINYLFGQLFSPLGFLYGIFFTLLSPLIFSLLIFDTLFNITVGSNLWLGTLKIANSISGPTIFPPLLIALPFYLFYKRPIVKRVALILVLLISIETANPIIKRGFINKAPLNYSHKVIKKNRIIHTYDNGLRCNSRLYTDHWSTHCRK